MYLLLFGWLLTPLSALADSKVQFLCIELRNGTTAEFALADHPVITLTGGTMKAETSGKTITASLADIVRYTFKEEGGTTGIGNEPQTQASQHASISVITIDGRRVLQAQAGTDGSADIDLSQQQPGVYIIQTAAIKLKVFNKR